MAKTGVATHPMDATVIKGYDPVVLISSALLLSVVSLAAGYLPAMRASRIDPIQALRYE